MPYRLLCLVLLIATSGFRAQQLPPVPVPPENPITPAKAVLGKILFWDEQLSANGRVACATCHTPVAGGSDTRFARHPGRDNVFNTPDDIDGSPGLPRADANNHYSRDPHFGFAEQVTNRSAPTAIGAAYFRELFWDGRAGATFRDPVSNQVVIANGGALENQVLGPLLSPAEMAHDSRTWAQITTKVTQVRPLALAASLPADLSAALAVNPTYPALFAAAFGDPAVTPTRIALAIATHERTLVPNQTPWDRFVAGETTALTPNQLAGQALFAGRARCAQCHQPPLFSDQSYRFIGVRQANEDPGRQLVTSNPTDAGRMKVPTLRNAALKRRFMHPGQFTSLAQLVGFYNAPPPPLPGRDPLIGPLNLNPTERGQLVDFLQALVDPRVVAGTGPFSRPTLFSETDPLRANQYGAPTSGSSGYVPRLLGDAGASVANPEFKIGIHDALGGAPALLALAAARALPGSTVLGLPLHVDPTTTVPLPLALTGVGLGGGAGTFVLPIPALAQLAGAELFGQWFVLDAGGLNGMAATSGARWVVR